MSAYYRFFCGDYLRDTMHLGWLEDIAYRRLIDLYMSRGRPIANDRSYIMRAIRANEPEQQAATDAVLSEFFTLQIDGWHQQKCDLELSHIMLLKNEATKAAKTRWSRHREKTANQNKDMVYADAMRTQCIGNANQNQNQNQIKSTTTTPKKSRSRQPDQPLPEGWTPSGRCVDALKAELGLTDREIGRYVVAFADLCAAKGYRYQSFDAAFRNCVRADWPRLRAAPSSAPARQETLEEIARERGLEARPGESWQDFERRVRTK